MPPHGGMPRADSEAGEVRRHPPGFLITGMKAGGVGKTSLRQRFGRGLLKRLAHRAGVAQFEKDVVATLLDIKTMESQVVSRKANFQGWQLVGVGGDPDRMQTWTARIQVTGGEVVPIRYQKPPPIPSKKVAGKSGGPGSSGSGGNPPPLNSSQMDAAKNAAVNYKEGFDADGYPKALRRRWWPSFRA